MPELTVIDCGVDWITASALKGEGYDYFAERSSILIDLERRRGNDCKLVTIEGYQGFKAGAVAAGSNGERMLVRLSSHMAQEHWQELAAQASNISRLDLQVTVRHEPDVPQLAERCERLANKYLNKRNLITNARLIRDRKKGSTLYLGERVSDVFARLYSKYRESRLEAYTGCWRYEVEYKRKHAARLAQELLRADQLGAVASGEVKRVFVRSGVPCTWPAPSRHLSIGRQDRGTDTARRLAWIESQVKSNVKKLYDAGYLNEAIEALGLSELIDWKAKDSKEE